VSGDIITLGKRMVEVSCEVAVQNLPNSLEKIVNFLAAVKWTFKESAVDVDAFRTTRTAYTSSTFI